MYIESNIHCTNDFKLSCDIISCRYDKLEKRKIWQGKIASDTNFLQVLMIQVAISGATIMTNGTNCQWYNELKIGIERQWGNTPQRIRYGNWPLPQH